MTPKTISQNFLKRAGELSFFKTLLRLEISRDEKEKRILEKIVKSVN
jgi:hypothetical protein